MIPQDVLQIGAALCGCNTCGDVVKTPMSSANRARIYQLTLPQNRNTEVKPPPSDTHDPSSSSLYDYYFAVERLYKSGRVVVQLDSLVVKIIALEYPDEEKRYEQIYDRILDLSCLSCVKHHYNLKSQFYVIISEKADCDLKTYLETEELTLLQKIKLCRQYSKLVRKLHIKKIVHGDLKPDNVLVVVKKEKKISLRLTDFEGSYLLEENDTLPEITASTPGYFDFNQMIFETFSDLENHDLFSLAVNIIDIIVSDGTSNPWKITNPLITKPNAWDKKKIFSERFGKQIPEIQELVDGLFSYNLKIDILISKLQRIEQMKMETFELLQYTLKISDSIYPLYKNILFNLEQLKEVCLEGKQLEEKWLSDSSEFKSNISQININDEPITSKWIKLRRMKYIQNGASKTLDIAMVNDSVSCLIYQKTRQEFIIVKQFRPSVHARQLYKEHETVQNVNIESDKIEYTFELCAGLKDKNLPPNQTIQAEVEEECGYKVPISNIQHVNTYYTSTASMQHMFYIEMDDETESKWKVSEGGGLECEGEILIPIRLPLDKVSSFLKESPKPSTLVYAITWWFLEKATKEQRELLSNRD